MRIEPTIENIEVFKPNSYFENLARLKIDKPSVYNTLSESEKLTLSIYFEQKAKHAEEQSK